MLSLAPSLANYGSQISTAPSPTAPSAPFPSSAFSQRHLFDNLASLGRTTAAMMTRNDPLLTNDRLTMTTTTAPAPVASNPLSQHSASPYVSHQMSSNTAYRPQQQRSTPSTLGHQTPDLHGHSQLSQLMALSQVSGANMTEYSHIQIPPTSGVSQSETTSVVERGYSPVSPPSRDTVSPLPIPLNLNSAHMAGYLKKDMPLTSMGNSVHFTPIQGDNFVFAPEKTLDTFTKISTPVGVRISDKLVGSTHQQMSTNLDMPLDMTKVFNSNDNVAQDMSISRKNTNLHPPTTTSVSDRGNIFEQSSLDFEFRTNLQFETGSKESIMNKPNQIATDRQLKPSAVRSNPKKSNFYGRNASLFSYANDSLSQQTQSLPIAFAGQSQVDYLSDANASSDLMGSASLCPPLISGIKEKAFDLTPTHNPFDAGDDNLVANMGPGQEAMSLDPDAPNLADSFIDATTKDCEPVQIMTVNEHVSDSAVSTNAIEIKPDLLGDKPSGSLEVRQDSPHSSIPASMMKELKCSLVTDAAVELQNNPMPFILSAKSTEHVDALIMPNPEEDDEDTEVEGEVESLKSNEIVALPVDSIASLAKLPPKRKRRKVVGPPAKPRKRGKKQQNAVPAVILSTEGVVGNPLVVLDHVSIAGEALIIPAAKPAPARARRKRGAALSSMEQQEDKDATPRRSSSRKSKSNAMRLIELQADSGYGYASQVCVEEDSKLPPAVVSAASPEKKRAPRTKNPAKTPVVIEESLESLSSDEASDKEKDAEYAPDEEEELQGDMSPVEEGKVTKNAKGKKVGGLKISIKLGTENLAQIVSNIRDKPSAKKRKVKKTGKSKVKSRAIVDEDDNDNDEENNKGVIKEDNIVADPNFSAGSTKSGESSSAASSCSKDSEEKVNKEDKEKSLLDKYFSAANAVNKQLNTEWPLKKQAQLKKKPLNKSVATKMNRPNAKGDSIATGTAKGTVGKKVKSAVLKSIMKFEADNEGVELASVTGEAAKFVCGYCPKRYHNKDELMTHMEGHMAEMESKTDRENSSDGKKVASGPASKKVKLQGISEKVESKPLSLGVNKTEKVVSSPEHKCGECSQVFPSKQALLEHMGSHTDEKPFECNLCHKCFKERDQLSVHRKTHSQDNLVRCPICSKGFIHEPDLVLHIRTHPKRSTPLVPLKRKLYSAVSPQNSAKTQNLSSSSPSSQGVELSRYKPSSFASALSGQEDGASTKLSTIQIKRIDPLPSATTQKMPQESRSAASTNRTFPGNKTAPQKPSKTLEIKDSSMKTHSGGGELMDGNTLSKENVNKTDPDAKVDGDHCTCQECPDCVTRFLKEFY